MRRGAARQSHATPLRQQRQATAHQTHGVPICRAAQRFALGDNSVSLSDAMISLQKSGIALQQTIQVRNKLVEAYQSMMNMGI